MTEDEYFSHFVWTVDCRTGETSRHHSPIPVPQDRREDLPTAAELRGEEG